MVLWSLYPSPSAFTVPHNHLCCMLVIVLPRKVLSGCGHIPRSSVLGRWVWTYSQAFSTGDGCGLFPALSTGVGVVSSQPSVLGVGVVSF